MSHVAEKARYHLEQSTPQLHDFAAKRLFTPQELHKLVLTRSEHEHRCLAPNSTPPAWLSYLEWDISLESLRHTRARSRDIASPSHPGESRILNTFTRAVSRHPASKPLWLAYLDYASAHGAGRRWVKVWHRAIRLHSRDPRLWVLGAQRAAGDGDMDTARTRFLNGARHCVGEGATEVWVAYAKAELEWLGVTEEKVEKGQHTVDLEGDRILLGGGSGEDSDDGLVEEGDDEGEIKPPTREQREAIDQAAAEQLKNSSVFEGAMPKAVFDVARKQDFFCAEVARRFWEAFAQVEKASRRDEVMAHVLAAMEEAYPGAPETEFCRIRTPLVGKEEGVAWGKGFKETLGLLERALEECVDPERLVGLVCPWLESLSRDKKFEPFVSVIEGVRDRLSDSLTASNDLVDSLAA